MGLAAHLQKVQEILGVDVWAVIKGQGDIAISFTVIYGLTVRNVTNAWSCNFFSGRSLGSYVGVTPRAIANLTGRRGAIQVTNSAPAVFIFSDGITK